MKPAAYNLPSVTRGDTWSGFRVTGVLVDEAAPSSNLSSVAMQFQADGDLDGAIVQSLTSGGGDITINDAATWDFTVNATVLSGLVAGRYRYDLTTTDAAGVLKTYLEGYLMVHQDV